jgi:hypothetical protein
LAPAKLRDEAELDRAELIAAAEICVYGADQQIKGLSGGGPAIQGSAIQQSIPAGTGGSALL